MRKFLAIILMLVMLTPSLVCAMPVCIDKAGASSIEQPCAGHNNLQDIGKKKSPGKVTLMKDCMGVDLQVADNDASIIIPNLKKDLPFDTGFAADTVKGIFVAAVIGDRGPLSYQTSFSKTQPSLLLTTQRLRI